ncbi:MAG TPA: Calx-beta domain-containing protein, partial [Candidatus Sulfotelmatobacter sp.]|nr:Calx-beta domain-containing protein [Candidatus Sulfotelmatobacter sp.]
MADSTFAAQVNAEPTRIQPLPDGRILISGAFTNVNGVLYPGVARLLENGALDTGFVPPKVVGAASQLAGLAGPGGEVWVTGSFTNLSGVPCNRIARLLASGAMDLNFRSPFAAADSVTVLAVQLDGKALVSGSFSNVLGLAVAPLVRLNVNGTLDLTFQSGLAPNERIFRALLLPDGRLVAAVAAMADYGMAIAPQRLVRLQPNGALDPGFAVTFESPGFPYNAGVYALALQADGKLLVSGTFLRVNGQSRGKLARLTAEGQLDECFEVALAAELTPLGVASGLDGSVILGGNFGGLQDQWHPYLLRLQPAAPCAPGVIEMAVPTVQAREDALRVVVPVMRHGATDLEQTVEYSTHDGSAQSGADYEAVSGTLHFAPGERSQFISIPLRPDGSVEGPETFEVWLSQAGGGASLGALTNVTVTLMDGPAGTAGAPDTNYVVQLDGPVQRILPLADGRAIIAGSFTNVNGQLCPNLARLLADGTRDPGFGRTQALDGEVYAMALDSAGRLLVAGYFQRVDGVWRPGLARFGTDGTLDMAFKPFEGWPTNSYGGITMQSLAVLADGSIVCGGEIPEDNYYTRDALLKFSPAGDLDTAFTNRMPPSLIASKLSPLPDGDFLLIGGGFGGSLVRLHPDGSINFGFLPPADRQFAYYGGDLGVLPDGRVTVAGIPSSFYGLLSLPPVWRLNPDGSLDSGFSVSNSVSAPGNLQSVDALSVAADGRVLVAGSFSTATSSMRTLRRLQADGAMDWSFDPGTGLKATASSGAVYLNALVSLPGGGWLLGGDFASYNGFNQPHLVKVLPEAVTQPLVISFNVTNAAVTVRETNTVLTFEVRRGGDAFSPASVTVRTADGTATAGQDYQPIDTTLNFGLGEWSKTIGVTLLDDRLVESTEQFTLYLTNATSGFSL